MRFFLTFIFSFFLFSHIIFAQCNASTANCVKLSVDGGTSEYRVIPEPDQPVHFSFENFKDYAAGIVYYGVSKIKIRVDALNADCKWQLQMSLGGNWSQDLAYTSAQPDGIPDVSLFKFRVNNYCNTPENAGVWQSFANAADVIPIIDDYGALSIPNNATSPCVIGTHYNGAGDYLQYYTSMTFTLDYKIGPFFNAGSYYNYTSGLYNLNLKFCISEY